MALAAAGVLELPDLACIGVVSKVGQAYLSKSGAFYVVAITIDAKGAGRAGTFFLTFEPRWFGDGFNPKDLLSEPEGSKLYGMYRRTVNNGTDRTTLAALLNDRFDAFAAEFDGNPEPTPSDIDAALRKHLVGQDVLYIMVQRTDDSGELMEQYNIKSFFAINDDNINYLMEQVENKGGKRKTPLVITWDV